MMSGAIRVGPLTTVKLTANNECTIRTLILHSYLSYTQRQSGIKLPMYFSILSFDKMVSMVWSRGPENEVVNPDLNAGFIPNVYRPTPPQRARWVYWGPAALERKTHLVLHFQESSARFGSASIGHRGAQIVVSPYLVCDGPRADRSVGCVQPTRNLRARSRVIGSPLWETTACVTTASVDTMRTSVE